MTMLRRRQFLRGALAAGASMLLGGCDRITRSESGSRILASAETLTRWAQRAVVPADAMVREYTERDISPVFRGNGTTNPTTSAYRAMLAANFSDWRLSIGGLVARGLLDECHLSFLLLTANSKQKGPRARSPFCVLPVGSL